MITYSNVVCLVGNVDSSALGWVPGNFLQETTCFQQRTVSTTPYNSPQTIQTCTEKIPGCELASSYFVQSPDCCETQSWLGRAAEKLKDADGRRDLTGGSVAKVDHRGGSFIRHSLTLMAETRLNKVKQRRVRIITAVFLELFASDPDLLT